MSATYKTAAEAVRAAADAVQAVNHLTRAPSEVAEWEMPGDAYAVAGSLSRLADRLPQAIEQLHGLIDGLAQDGRLRHDDGPGRLVDDLLALRAATARSARAAVELSNELADVHAALSHLGMSTEEAA